MNINQLDEIERAFEEGYAIEHSFGKSIEVLKFIKKTTTEVGRVATHSLTLEFYPSGALSRRYETDGLLHRSASEGPAFQRIERDGSASVTCYAEMGKISQNET